MPLIGRPALPSWNARFSRARRPRRPRPPPRPRWTSSAPSSPPAPVSMTSFAATTSRRGVLPRRARVPQGQVRAQARVMKRTVPSGDRYVQIKSKTPRAQPQHGVRGGAMPQPRRVLGWRRGSDRHRHHHDHGRHVHPRMPILRGEDVSRAPASGPERTRERRRGHRRVGPRLRRVDQRRPRRSRGPGRESHRGHCPETSRRRRHDILVEALAPIFEANRTSWNAWRGADWTSSRTTWRRFPSFRRTFAIVALTGTSPWRC